jgi:hypothetical protein
MGNTQSPQKSFGSVYPNENTEARPGYYFGKGKLIYQGTPVELLPDESSFQKLKYSYAKSDKRVFYKGVPIHGANPKTFVSINRPDVKKFSNKPELLKLNSVLGMDIENNNKRFYYRGNLIHTE